jgi:hypothetical protein
MSLVIPVLLDLAQESGPMNHAFALNGKYMEYKEK